MPATRRPELKKLRTLLVWFFVVLAVQVVYGAFTAGLDAGKAFNTYPLMAGSLLPPHAWRLDPAIRNFVDNIALVQWIHRTLPLILLGLAVWSLMVARRVAAREGSAAHARWGVALLATVSLQFGLGVATLLLFVPISLAVIHQAVAVVLFGVLLMWLHLVVAEERTRS